MKPNPTIPQLRLLLPALIFSLSILLIPFVSSAQTAPVNPPTGGFAIDGNLVANTTVSGIGDWIPGGVGAGGFVMTAAGVPVNPARTFHIVDPYNGGDDVMFGGHFNDNPNTNWNWVTGSTNGKTDINNILLHFTTNPANNHNWAIFAGDRASTNGTSYIDFEFLQNTIVKNVNGTFTSAGPDAGRTVNDLLFAVEYTGGGGSANFVFYKWTQISPGVFDYVNFTPPPNTAFGFTSGGGESVPYGAFAATTYLSNQFVEGALDLDSIVGSYITTCSGISIKTFLCKTKVSTSPTANLGDLIGPMLLNLTIGFAANTATGTPINCFGQCTGTASTTVSGGTSPFAYTWTPSGQHGQTATNLCAGTYTVTVTDARSCTTTATVTITQPTALNVATTTATAASCFGGCNGSIIASPSGGTPAYTYTWTPGNQHGQTATNLCAGNYTLTVTDSHGCTAVHTNITVSQPTPLTTGMSTGSVSCNGGNNGSACATPAGGTPNYTYLWNPSSQTTSCANNLTAGNYTVTVTDSHGCTVTNTITVTQPAVLTMTTSNTNVNCYGGNNATAWANPSGGTPGYNYVWSTSPPQNGQTATGLSAGTYTIVVTDSRGCQSTQFVTITEPPQLTGSASIISNVSCNGACDAIAYVTGSGGSPGYTYSWSPSNQTGQTASGLCAGPHFVTITDSHGCTTQTNVIAVSQPQPLIASASGIDSVNCFGGSDGSIILSVSGGTLSYTYSWTPNGGSGDTASNLTAGCYTATITDSHGCTATASACVGEPTQLLSTVSTQTDVSCNGGNNGMAVIGASGGSPQYTYTWNPSVSNSNTATGLSAGSYTVTVTDANGCSTIQPLTITEPTALALQDSSLNSTCTQSNGTAWVVATGGTGSYTYSWTPVGQQGQTATSLTSGIYTVTVTDANGCTAVDFVQVSDAGGPSAAATAISQVSCNGDSTGSAWVVVSSGTPPFTYSWSPIGGNGATATGLTADTYFITVTDSNGCVAIDTVTITQPPTLVSSITSSSNVICNGQGDGTATVTAGGGTPAYTYSWSNGDTTSSVTGLSPNTYTVTVTDALGCFTVDTVIITEPNVLLTVLDSIHNVGCHGESTGNIYTSTAGGTLGYTYSWVPSGLPTDSDLIGISAGTYTLIVTDANGCTSSITATVTEPDTIVPLIDAITLNGFEIRCYGDSNGIAYVDTIFGGTYPFTYVWSTSDTTDTIYNLHPGQYSITVYDINGCSADTFITLTQPLPIALQETSADITCSNSCDGWIAIDSTWNGVGGYTYVWSTIPPDTTTSISNLCAGSYTVTVTDLNGCTTQAVTVLTQPNPITIGATFSDFNTYNISCNGASDGCIDITAIGGTGTLYIIWTPTGDTTFIVCGLSADTPYTAHITDDNGCILDTTFILTQPPAVNGSLASSPNLCNGDSTGIAWATVSGGVTPYTYLWTPSGQTGSTATGLTAGVYTSTITDANGCLSIASVTVTQPTSLAASIQTQTNVNCFGDATGNVTVIVGGGTPSYQYSLNGGPFGSSSTFIGLVAGSYTVTIRDTNGCITTVPVNITQPASGLNAAINTQTNVDCFGNATGSVTVLAGGGTPAYTYSIDGINFVASPVFSGLTAGSYTITIMDANGCITTVPVTITGPSNPLNASVGSQIDVLCYGNSTGSITVTVNGGTPAYQYSLNGGPFVSGSVFGGLPSGSYTVIILDANGCSTTVSTSITQPSSPISTDAGPYQSICGDSTVLSAQLNSGENGTWSVQIGNGIFNTDSTANAQVLSLQYGTNILVWTIVDADGCIASDTVSVNAFENIQADANSPDTTICQSDFTYYQLIAVNPAPGTGLWSVNLGNQNGIANPAAVSTQYTNAIAGPNIILWTVNNGPCRNQDTVVVTIKTDGECLDLGLPNGFTPNDDNYNDSYIIHGIEAYPENTFIVFNRWGNEVYHKDNYKNNGYNADWFGQNNHGKPLPDGTYYVILVIKDSSLKKNTYVDLRR